MSTIVFIVLMAICFAGLVGTICYVFGVRDGIKLGKDYQRLKDKEEALENVLSKEREWV